MRQRVVILSAVVLCLGPSAALAFCPSGYPNEIFCDDFDTYCTGNANWAPGGTKCDVALTDADDGLMRQVWHRIGINEYNNNLVGQEFTGEDLGLKNITSAPFGARSPAQPGWVLGFQSFRDWLLSAPIGTNDPPNPSQVNNMQRLIGNTFGSQYTAVAGTNNAPLVMQFVMSSGTAEKMYWTNSYMEVAKDDQDDIVVARANTDYVEAAPCDCLPTYTGPLPILCAQGNPASALPGGCPSASTAGTAPVRHAIAAGSLALLDPTPCHCSDALGNAGYNRNLVVFDGRLWWTLRANDPLPTTGALIPKDAAPTDPPAGANLTTPGSFTLNGGTGGDINVFNRPAYNRVTLTIWATTFDVELRTQELSLVPVPGSDPAYYPEYYVTSVMRGLPRAYLGEFDTIHAGVGGGCPLASSASWTACGTTGESPYPYRRPLKPWPSKGREFYVDFDDFVLYGGEGYAPAGACCHRDASCSVVLPSECTAYGDRFNGSSTKCATARCCPFPFADADKDRDVDMDDFAALQRCFTFGNPGVAAGCECFNRNGGNTIDTDDIDQFVKCVTGPSVPWSQGLAPDCVP